LEFENLSSLHLQVPSKFDYSQMNHSWRLTSCGSPHYDLSGWKCKVIFGINNVKVLKIHANTDLTILFFFIDMIFKIHIGYLTSRMKPTWISLLTWTSICEMRPG
jgi:hypothetical protein